MATLLERMDATLVNIESAQEEHRGWGPALLSAATLLRDLRPLCAPQAEEDRAVGAAVRELDALPGQWWRRIDAEGECREYRWTRERKTAPAAYSVRGETPVALLANIRKHLGQATPEPTALAEDVDAVSYERIIAAGCMVERRSEGYCIISPDGEHWGGLNIPHQYDDARRVRAWQTAAEVCEREAANRKPAEEAQEPPADTRPTLQEWLGDDGGAVNALKFCMEQGWGMHLLHSGAGYSVSPGDPERSWVKSDSAAECISAACAATGTKLPWREEPPEWKVPETCVGCEIWLRERAFPVLAVSALASVSYDRIADVVRWVHAREEAADAS